MHFNKNARNEKLQNSEYPTGKNNLQLQKHKSKIISN